MCVFFWGEGVSNGLGSGHCSVVVAVVVLLVCCCNVSVGGAVGVGGEGGHSCSCVAVGGDQQLVGRVVTPPTENHAGTQHAQHLHGVEGGAGTLVRPEWMTGRARPQQTGGSSETTIVWVTSW